MSTPVDEQNTQPLINFAENITVSNRRIPKTVTIESKLIEFPVYGNYIPSRNFFVQSDIDNIKYFIEVFSQQISKPQVNLEGSVITDFGIETSINNNIFSELFNKNIDEILSYFSTRKDPVKAQQSMFNLFAKKQIAPPVDYSNSTIFIYVGTETYTKHDDLNIGMQLLLWLTKNKCTDASTTTNYKLYTSLLNVANYIFLPGLQIRVEFTNESREKFSKLQTQIQLDFEKMSQTRGGKSKRRYKRRSRRLRSKRRR